MYFKPPADDVFLQQMNNLLTETMVVQLDEDPVEDEAGTEEKQEQTSSRLSTSKKELLNTCSINAEPCDMEEYVKLKYFAVFKYDWSNFEN